MRDQVVKRTLNENVHLTANEVRDYIQSRLAPPDREMVEAHLVDCPYCAAELKLMQELLESWEHEDLVNDDTPLLFPEEETLFSMDLSEEISFDSELCDEPARELVLSETMPMVSLDLALAEDESEAIEITEELCVPERVRPFDGSGPTGMDIEITEELCVSEASPDETELESSGEFRFFVPIPEDLLLAADTAPSPPETVIAPVDQPYKAFWVGDRRYGLRPGAPAPETLEIYGLALLDLLSARAEDKRDPGACPAALEAREGRPITASLGDFEPVGDPGERQDHPLKWCAFQERSANYSVAVFPSPLHTMKSLPPPPTSLDFQLSHEKGPHKGSDELQPILEHRRWGRVIQILHQPSAGKLYLHVRGG